MISAPSKTCEAPIRPVIGARTSAYSTPSRASVIAARLARDLRLRFLGGGDGVVVDLLADRVFREQRLVALDVLAGAGEVRLGGSEIRVGGRDLRAVFARVDRIQQLPLIDHRAVGEMLAGQNAVDARADLDLLRAAYLADQVAVDLRRRRRDDDDLDVDRGRARGRRIATAARGERAGEGEQGGVRRERLVAMCGYAPCVSAASGGCSLSDQPTRCACSAPRSRGCGKRLAASLSRTQQFPQAIERGLRVARRQGVRVERAKFGDDRGLRRVGHDVER